MFAISSLSYSIFSIVSLKDRVLTSAKISTLLTEKALRNIFHTKYSFFANYKKEKIINNVLTEASVVTTSVLRPLLDQTFDFEKRMMEQKTGKTGKFTQSGSYLYFRSGLIERWNTLNKFQTYPDMIKPLKI